MRWRRKTWRLLMAGVLLAGVAQYLPIGHWPKWAANRVLDNPEAWLSDHRLRADDRCFEELLGAKQIANDVRRVPVRREAIAILRDLYEEEYREIGDCALGAVRWNLRGWVYLFAGALCLLGLGWLAQLGRDAEAASKAHEAIVGVFGRASQATEKAYAKLRWLTKASALVLGACALVVTPQLAEWLNYEWDADVLWHWGTLSVWAGFVLYFAYWILSRWARLPVPAVEGSLGVVASQEPPTAQRRVQGRRSSTLRCAVSVLMLGTSILVLVAIGVGFAWMSLYASVDEAHLLFNAGWSMALGSFGLGVFMTIRGVVLWREWEDWRAVDWGWRNPHMEIGPFTVAGSSTGVARDTLKPPPEADRIVRNGE